MRILYLADIRFPLERANGIQTMQTCHALAGRSHAVTLMVRADTARPPRDPFAYYGLPAIPSLEVRSIRVGGPPAARRAIYALQSGLAVVARRVADVVLTRDLGIASLLLALPRAVRAPLVYESHGYAPAVSGSLDELLSGAKAAGARKKNRLETRERRVWGRADGYATITAGLAAELTQRFGPRPRLAVVPDGAALAGGRTYHEREPNTPPVVVYAGHLYPWKGVDVLIDALAALPGVRAVIVGGHPAEPDLARTRARAVERGIAERVEFTGLVPPPDVAAYLTHADVLVAPNTPTAVSKAYTSPLKLFEYLAAGRPIVASDLPAIREVLRHGENAVLVEPGSPEALAAGIHQVLSDAALARRLARRAFDDAGAFAWERRAERLEHLLEAARAA